MPTVNPACVSSFLTPGWIVASSDLILTAPDRLIKFFVDHFPVERFDLPFKAPKISVVQVWYERLDHDPLHRWFRSEVSRVCDRDRG